MAGAAPISAKPSEVLRNTRRSRAGPSRAAAGEVPA
jgi:hypothetical protein